MAQDIFASNGPTTTQVSGLTDTSSTTLVVASSTGFPAATTGVSQFRIADKAKPTEVMIVTNVSGTTWTVTRGAESTTPVAHTAGFTVYQALTAGVLTAISPLTFSPVNFGAKGDGTTDDSAAVKAAFAAAAAAGGTVDLGTRKFLMTSAIPLASNITVRGNCPLGSLGTAGTIINNTGDMFTVGSVSHVKFTDCALLASAGHVFNAATGSCSFWSITGTYITQSDTAHSIWYMTNGVYIDMLVGDGSYFIAPLGGTVVPWTITSQAACNSNTWRRLRISTSLNQTVPFFYLESTLNTAHFFNSGNVFEDITAEQCQGGIIQALSAESLTIGNVKGYDAAYHLSLFSVGTSSTGLQPSQNIVVRNSGRGSGGIVSGFDFQATTDTTNIILENVGGPAGPSDSLISVPVATTIIPPQVYSPTVWLNSAAGGTNGTTVTTGNSGGASGVAWSTVNGTVTFDSTQTLTAGASGLAYKLVTSATTAYLLWSVPPLTQRPLPPQYLRTYIYFSGTPFSTDVLTSAGLNYRLSYNASTGFWYVRAFPGTTVSGITTPAASTWYRVEAKFDQVAGTVTARIFTAAGVLLETITGTGGTTTTNTGAYYGTLDAATGTFWLAYPGWSNGGWIGP